MHPPFSFFSSCGEKRKRAVHGPKEKRDAGAEFDRRGQIRPRYGGWSELVPIELANLLPAASDPVPQRGTLPQLQLPSRLFGIFDARPPAPLPALRAWPGTFGQDSRPTAGKHPLFSARSQPGAKRGKRRKSLRPRIKSAERPSIEAKNFRNHQKVFFSFGPCTARQGEPRSGERALWRVFSFSARRKRENGGCILCRKAAQSRVPVPRGGPPPHMPRISNAGVYSSRAEVRSCV